MASELLVATRSADKLEEIRSILHLERARLVTLRDLGVQQTANEDAIEEFDTFVKNAVAKARYFAELTGMRVLADDSGLVVDALGGAPGVRTKRFAIDSGFVDDSVSGKQLDDANNTLLLVKLRDLPESNRSAHYVCAASYADLKQHVITSVGTCSGMINNVLQGNGGFGYDPLFLLPELSVTFAQLTREQKNLRSHRARAFRALAPHLL